MHKHSRLISGVHRSGKCLYGSFAVARVKTENEGDPPTVPSAKSWTRPPRTEPSTITRPLVSPRFQPQRDLGKWATQKEPLKSTDNSKDAVNSFSSSGRASKSVENHLPPSLVNPISVDREKGLGKWGTRKEVFESANSKGTLKGSSRASKVVEDHLPSPRVQTSSTDRGKRGSPQEFRDRKDTYPKNRSPSSDKAPPLERGRGSLPPHMTLPSYTRRSSDFLHKNERPRLPSECRKESSPVAEPAATSQKFTSSTSQRSRTTLSRPDYSSLHVFRDHEDRRHAPRRRDAPERNPYVEYNRREPVLNKDLIKKPVKRKIKQIVRRKEVFIPTTLTVAMLARLLKVKLAHLLNKMRRAGMDVEANYDYILSADYAALLTEEFGFNPVIDDEAAFDIYPPKPHPNPSTLPSRPPIVTIMGHVDHGKTTLLDTLRSASVAKGEAGGITQHIGAFSVPVASENTTSTAPRLITFLDTPGHAAFSAMRARGANVTDIVVLVVAADDGVMPQTQEVIELLKKEDNAVDLVVAINKIDKPNADPDTVKKGLMAYGVQLEDFGGDIPVVHVSGLSGEGLPNLIETLSAVAEVRDLRADQDGSVYGHVIESNVRKGLGSVATVLIRQGCLKIGSHIISGTAQGKVRRMTDSSGRAIQSALPGMAVTVSGWKTLPKAGDEVMDGSEGDIKKAIVNRLRREDAEALQEDAEAINESRRQERDARAEGEDVPAVPVANVGPKELKLLIKGDVSGSCEALEGALNNIGNGIAISKVIHTGVGDITESDILMAKAAQATIIGFSVSAPRSILSLAAQSEVPVCVGDIIYRLIDDVRSRIIDMLPKTIETKVTGEASVLQLFDITGKSKQIIKVAGCRVVNGLVEKQKFARVIRHSRVIHEGALDTMRQLKKEITEARKGTECGLTLKEFSDLQEGDLIQMYERIEKPGII